MRFHIQEFFFDFQSDDEARAIILLTQMFRFFNQVQWAFSGRLEKTPVIIIAGVSHNECC